MIKIIPLGSLQKKILSIRWIRVTEVEYIKLHSNVKVRSRFCLEGFFIPYI